MFEELSESTTYGKSGERKKVSGSLTLTDKFFDEVKKHPVPISFEVIKNLKKSPLAVDLYAYLTYRANTGRHIHIRIEDLKMQFGEEAETWRFKQSLERALKSVKREWDECAAFINDDVLVLPKMRQHIEKKAKPKKLKTK